MPFTDLLFWSDTRWLYDTVTWSLYALLVFLVFLSVWPEKLSKSGWEFLSSPWFFAALVCLFMLTARWPGFFHPESINPDEDQLLVAAWALTKDPIFFRSAECGSSGPMNVYPLLLPKLFGWMPTLFSGRLIGTLMLAISISAIYFAFRCALTEWTARAGALMALTFFGWTYFWDFRHYTSEHSPVFFMALAWAALSYVAFGKQSSSKIKILAACFSAISLAMVPLAKLQAIYPAALSGIFLLIAVFFCVSGSPIKRILAVALVGLAALLVPLGFALIFALTSVAEYAWLSYIGNALAYRGDSPGVPAMMSLFWQMLTTDSPLRSNDLSLMVLGASILSILLIAGLFFPRLRAPRRSSLIFTGGALLILMGTIYSITSPMRPYPHYLVFLPLPLTLTCAGLLQCFTDCFSLEPPGKNRTALVIALGLFLLFTAFPVAKYRVHHPHVSVGHARNYHEYEHDLKKREPLPKLIIEHAAGGNGYLAAWGYNPRIYQQTEMLSATRLSTSSSIFNQNELRDFFLQTYLQDLQNKEPTVFVDVVAPGQFMLMNDRMIHGYEQVPEIQSYVDTHYHLVAEHEGVRIFLRRNPPNF